MEKFFKGYLRSDGTAGTRDYIGIISSVICSSIVAKEISNKIPNAIPIIHSNGCAQLGDDFRVTKNMLIGVASNPNLRSVLVVGLGCETNQISGLLESIPKTKPVKGIGIQQLAGGENTLNKGIEIANEWREIVETKRETLPLSYLSVGITTVEADEETLRQVAPVVGKVIDYLVGQNSTVIMGLKDSLEPVALRLADRSDNEETTTKLLKLGKGLHRKRWSQTTTVLGDAPAFSEEEIYLANLEADLTGESQIKSLLDYNDKPKKKGLHLAKTSSNLVETLSNMASCGCNIALIVSSRGVLTASIALPGLTIMPKNSDESFEGLEDYRITEDSISHQAEKVINELIEISSGKLTSLETLELGEFSIPHVGTTF